LDDVEGHYFNRNGIGCSAFSLATAEFSCFLAGLIEATVRHDISLRVYVCADGSVMMDASECNGVDGGCSSRSNSPQSADTATVDASAAAMHVLWRHGYCKWPACDTNCDNAAVFLRSSVFRPSG